MDDRTAQRVLEKAEYVGEAVQILADKRDTLSFEAYATQREQKDVVEREFQTAIEACIDIGLMLLDSETGSVPETNADVFRALRERDVLDEETSDRMADAAGFRNVLAHQYGSDIDDRDVYNFLQHELPIFYSYLSQVREQVD